MKGAVAIFGVCPEVYVTPFARGRLITDFTYISWTVCTEDGLYERHYQLSIRRIQIVRPHLLPVR